MSERFDKILDECIDRVILGDETVEACLARYPEYAAELEGPLRLAIRAGSSFAFTPTSAAKERGRQRLRAELEALQQADERKSQQRTSWLVPTLIWPLPRWAVAAASLFLSVVLGSAATAAASSGALPGDTLYPVKRATEEAGLVLQLSDKGKAALHLAYAERRSQEISVLLERGDSTRVAPTLSALQESLTSATRIATTLQDEEALSSLESQVDEGASAALSNLQSAVQNSPESVRQQASDLLQAASESYGETVTAVAAIAPPRYVAASPGILEIRAMDPPPPGIDKLLVEVGEIEAHLATGSGKGWVTITQNPQTFDLLQIVDVQRLLGEQKVEPGTYTKVRFSINKATVVIAGAEHQARVASGRLELARPLRVEEGKRTVVLLDFDSAASLRVTGRDQYTLTLKVTVLTQEPGQEKRQKDRGKEKERDKEEQESDRKGPSRPETPQVRVEIEGTIEALTAQSLVVRGKTVLITASTEVERALEKGQRVKVRAISQPDGALSALRIEVEEGNKGPSEKAPEKPTDTAAEIQGVIDSLSPGRWVVAGREVRLTTATKITGEAIVKGLAHVTGSLQPDGAILATEIVVRAPEPGPKEKEDQEQRKQDQQEDKDKKDKDQRKEPDGSSGPSARPDKPALVRLTGKIDALRPSGWRLNGQEIVVTKDTVVEGTPQTGLEVQLEGEKQPDGTVVALSVRVRESVPTPTTPSPPTPTPRPRATPTPAPIQLEGVVEQMDRLRWRVSGHTVVIDRETEIEGSPVPGAEVRVEGIQREDGTVLAVKVEVQKRNGEKGPDRRPAPTATPVPATTPGPQATPTPEAAPTPTPTPQSQPTPPPASIHLEGELERIDGLVWQVDDRIVVITAQTRIQGQPLRGARVSIEGVRRADGAILATQIRVLRRPG